MQEEAWPAAELASISSWTSATQGSWNPGALARSLLSAALDQLEPEPATIVALLDSIPGALERAQQGLREVRSVPLDEL